MKFTQSSRNLTLIASLLAMMPSQGAEPSPRPTNAPDAPAGDAALTPPSLTSGTVLKIKAATTTLTDYTPAKGGSKYPGPQFNFVSDQNFTWKTPSSYADSDGDEFSCVYKRIDNFTAQINFDQTKNSGGTLKQEHGTGKLFLLFTSYDKTTSTYHGTVVTSDSYNGTDTDEGFPVNYVDFSNGSGIFSLKIK